MLVAATVLLDPVVVMYCLERRQMRSQHPSQGPSSARPSATFMPSKSICCQIILSCLCPPRATHATTLAFIKFRMILLFSVKDETRRTLFSCYFLVCFTSDRNTLFQQFKGSHFFTHLKRKGGKKGGSEAAFLHTCKFLQLLLS